MKQSTFILLFIGVIIGVTASIYYFSNATNAGASVVTGSEYISTTTDSTYAGSHRVLRTTVNAPSCTIGSVIVASSSATAFTVWNATSTTDVASTTLATFKASVAEGTYTFDSACSRGIAVSFPAGFNGSVVFTHR